MTTLTFRNVDVSPADPVSAWPLEAIQTALECGGLADWRRLAAAIKAEPWGPIARRVEGVLSYSRPYGVAVAFERAIARSRDTAESAEREAVAVEVRELVDRSGLSQTDFASRIGTSASRLSTYVRGKVTPSAALLLRMRRVAGIERSGIGQRDPQTSSRAASISPTGSMRSPRSSNSASCSE